MAVDWNAVHQELIPIKGYEDLCARWQVSLGHGVVRAAYNFTLPELSAHTQRCLGGDTRGRYASYEARLGRIFAALEQAGVRDVLDLMEQTRTRANFERLAQRSGLAGQELAAALKYLTYWFIPMSKPLSSLVRADPVALGAVKTLRDLGVRSNLDLLERGCTADGRQALAEAGALPETMILELVHRADFSRLPWASKATISNIIGAGYASLAQLAAADPQQLFQDFFRYGESIGKNLKLGNEIDNSYRIAHLVPEILR